MKINEIRQLSDEELQSELERLERHMFDLRAQAGNRFWAHLGGDAEELSDDVLLQSVLPWIEASSDEVHPDRDRLVALVRRRFPHATWLR